MKQFFPSGGIRVAGAAEILRCKGHSPPEMARLAGELGRAMKTAWESIRSEEVTTNKHEFGSSDSNDVRMHNAHGDSAFIDAVYRAFQRRDLFQRVCPVLEGIRSSTEQRVVEALQNNRGARERSRRRPGRGGNTHQMPM